MKFDTELCKIAYKYGTDKCPQLRHPYTPFYYELFKDRKESIKKVVEMGIGYYATMDHVNKIFDKNLNRFYHRGASLLMWRDFFPNATIYGADIEPEAMFKDDRIKTFICDERKEEDLKEFIKKIGSDIDIFIDDGIHGKKYQIFLCKTLMPLLPKDVTYIIEDVRATDIIMYYLGKKYDCTSPKLSDMKDKGHSKRKHREKLIMVKHKKDNPINTRGGIKI